MSNEASIIINGVVIPEPDSMTIRVAIEAMAMSLDAEGLGDDDHGKVMTKLYTESIDRIRREMYR
jgi:hypothetical protein